jgi:nitroimidazol reductase NimA-like FMN-containing flavoprotein (pyridoxamine 5'-phosphate oxidase superfamily)
MISESDMKYLLGAAVPLRLAFVTNSGWPIIVSLWYVHQDQKLYCATHKSAKILSHLRSGQRCAFEIGNNEPPYRGIRGRGIVTLRQGRGEQVLRTLLSRYLKNVDSPLAKRLLARSQDEIVIEIRPERVYSWDFTDRMRGSLPDS